eukprot:GDKJ01035587.1.p1 GENE.GDKJ01035587.1~~GDKJ01035587.1.p1  ORF type:complete len:261 (+),score=40.03 GDKJ01035587.1:32-784(+)
MKSRMLRVVQHTNSLRVFDDALKGELVSITEQIAMKAFLVITEEFPRKIIYFDKLSRNFENEGGFHVVSDTLHDEFNNAVSDKSGDVPPAKRVKTDGSLQFTGSLPCNKMIIDLTNQLCDDLGDLSSMLSSLKLWLQKAVPRIEDGNNFGVSILEDVISEITRVEEVSGTLCETSSKYHFSRGKIMGKILKYPNVDDYKESVRTLDKKQMLLLRQTIVDCRVNYGALLDHINKNFEKLVNPRTDNTTNMY